MTRPKDFTAPGYLAGFKDEFLFDIIKEGGSIFGKPAMPRWAHLLTDAEIRSLVAYLAAWKPAADPPAVQQSGSPRPVRKFLDNPPA